MVVTMGVSMVSGTKVLAAEELLTAPSVDSSDEIAQQNEIEDKADAVTEENSDDSVLERENISADGVAEEVEESVNDSTKPLIQYLYVEKPNLSVGEKQKIVVSVAENTEVNGVSLIYQKEETSEILETCSVNEADGANEFDILFPNESDMGTYYIQGVKIYNGSEEIVYNFKEIGIDAKFGVEEYCETEPDAIVENADNSTAVSDEAGISVMSLDDEDNIEDNTEVEESVNKEINSENDIAVYSENTEKTAKPYVIVLDPGHGGYDGGANGNGVNEKDLTLKIAKHCKKYLEQQGNAKVYMTRNDDTYVSLAGRVDYAASVNANLFVSIHLNSGGGYGAEVYYPNSNYRSDIGSEGKTLAQSVQDELIALGIYSRGIKIRNSQDSKYPDGSTQDYYAVIQRSKRAGFPGIIIEHAFIDNSNDFSAYLNSEEKLDRLGKADANGILKYIKTGKGEWKEDTNGWKYQYVLGGYAVDKWEKIDGFWYFFDKNGYRKTGFVELGSVTYYFNDEGKMSIGWEKINNNYYYFSSSGAMQIGWVKPYDTWYYVNSEGVMQTGWLKLTEGTYYLDESGALVEGWRVIDDTMCYFRSGGSLRCKGVTTIMGTSGLGTTKNTVVDKLEKMYLKSGRIYPAYYSQYGGAATIREFCEIIYEEATDENVKPEVVFGQAMKETGYLQFGGDVQIEQFNFAGLGATGNGVHGNSFANIREGIRAQVQHLKAYASKDSLNHDCVDVRFGYVNRGSAPYVEWLGIKENPNKAGWAASSEYGIDLVEKYISPMYKL